MSTEISVGMSEGKRAPILEADSYVGRLFMLADMGTHEAEYKNDKTGKLEKRNVRKVRLGFEIPGKVEDFGKGYPEPYTVGNDYNASFGGNNKPSNLLNDIQAWRGRPFTPEEKKQFTLNKLVGVPALLGVTHQEARNGNVYAKLHSIGKVPAGLPVPGAVLAPLVYSVTEGRGGCFEQLPKFIRERIEASKEWREMNVAPAPQPSRPVPPPPGAPPVAVSAAPADDCPF